MLDEMIKKVVTNKELTFEQTQAAIGEIMSGTASNVQIAAFLTALTMKKETVAEIAGAAVAMRNHALAFKTSRPTLEIVGTGGDHSNSFNISTTASLVVAAAGVPVAKHGNRAASSRSGAADVLEALGINIAAAPSKSQEILAKENICFLFAQKYHKAMRFVAPVRQELGIRTIFNILGPLANPAHATQQLLGVYDEGLLDTMPAVLQRIGVTSAMIVHGQDGLDEISLSAPTHIVELQNNHLKRFEITPEQFGLSRCHPKELVGGSAQDNAQITRNILAGATGPKRDIVLLNAAAAIHVAHPKLSLKRSLEVAATAIDSGAAQRKLAAFIALSNNKAVNL
ncbi:anthranilate phosphoribosyltransferase [Liquorilactobacillus capillatus]|uniref:Anthranilate phosphoribosyltransferase n=1 Tax=Liquorilactobacillus capillatus DSM 19910 TaxID=1423731 RepID=A0A0R1MCD2_9LACO|nr:anthranilate phosphoribosyltransferase [Liquorilactobacillus capillatus]KRL01827.1 anthranilate phosphoribosyltransferase [Liquorilactobacillus capillatus DSM 19910]